PPGVVYTTGAGPRPRSVVVDGGKATLGASFGDLDFGWDNEFPLTRVEVPAFVIDSTPVTNEQFRYFVDSGAYDQPAFWSEADWAWKTRMGLSAPLGWTRQDGAWLYRTLFDVIPMSRAHGECTSWWATAGNGPRASSSRSPDSTPTSRDIRGTRRISSTVSTTC